jgi:hypothetical protein
MDLAQYLPFGLTVGESVLAFSLTIFFGWLVRKYKLNKQVLEAVRVAVMKTYVEVVRPWKAKGKLTDDQAKKARQIAKKEVLELLKGAGLDLFKSLWDSKKDVLIERAVNAFKKDAK